MFTDFKNFTQASEQMSAEELVREINFYYSEFDNIISRHNIEKIKIIGDSYMCASGLPVVNERHALDVVAAALELQQFMIAQKAEKGARGASFFELRIGIHTGPVVAGIVGHKKFAYDIWGDTVNTASRMENAGEPNKINISGATYEKVKDHFSCTYRGKVEAKHKGLIDMYFVDTAKS
jgi:class 3 adenylate cyclase